MSKPDSTETDADVQIAELELRLRELQGIWAEANAEHHSSDDVSPPIAETISPHLTPTRPHTPPLRRSPRTFGQRSRDAPPTAAEMSGPVPLTSPISALPSVRSSAGSLAGLVPAPPSAGPRRASPDPREDAVRLPSLARPGPPTEATCAGCGQVPPRACAVFCSHCGRRLSQA